jgi:hypothetical protein
MLVEIINKFIMIVFILSILNIIRHSFFCVQMFVTSTEDNTKKYIISKSSLLLLGLSISYFITLIITGFSL